MFECFKKTKDETKTFVIINNYFVGDILLVNSLIQNIKNIYKNSRIVMLVQPGLSDLAKYQYGVDDVIVWDRKKEDKSFFNTIKFVKNFPYKNIYAIFPIFRNERAIYLSYLLRAKYILYYANANSLFLNMLVKTKYKLENNQKEIQKNSTQLLSGITKEKLIDYPIKFIPPQKDFTYSSIFNENPEKIISLCCTTTKVKKDMPYKTVVNLIKNLSDYKIILYGKGQSAQELSENLKKENLENLIDLSNKTSLIEAISYIQKSKYMISVDTGLMHAACAVKTPTVCVFYEKSIDIYKPNEDLYNVEIVKENKSVEEIINALNNLITKSQYK